MSRWRLVTVVSAALLAVSMVGWIVQLRSGLIVTNVRNPFSWGLYIATFAFFVGVAAGGLIISSSAYLFGVEKLKPLTRIASLSAFASVLGAAVMILPDMGRVDRLYQILLHPNLQSPLVWDVAVISTYALIAFLSVYFQLLPDAKTGGRAILAGWTKSMSLEEVEAISKKWSKRVAIGGLPIAILIHTVTAWLMALQASRSWWNTAVLPPDFIAVAVASGTAFVILVSLGVLGKEGFEEHKEAFRTLALIVSVALVVHFFLMYNDFVVRLWWGSPVEADPLLLTFTKYGWLHLAEVVLPVFTMLYFFTKKGRSSIAALTVGCLVLFVGVFAHRFLLMPAAFNVFPLSLSIPGAEIEGWQYPIAVGELREGMSAFSSFWEYTPSPIELVVTLMPFSLVALVVSVAVTRFRMVKSTAPSNGRTSAVDPDVGAA